MKENKKEQVINEELNKNMEYEPWDQDIYMYKKSCKSLREEIVNDMLKKIKPEEGIEELIRKETYQEIENLPIEKLQNDNILEFCVSYKKGYNLGKKLSKEKIDEIYHHKNLNKHKNNKQYIRK